MRKEAYVGSLGQDEWSVQSLHEAAVRTRLGSGGDDSSALLAAHFGSPPATEITHQKRKTTQYGSVEFGQHNQIIVRTTYITFTKKKMWEFL